MAELEGRTPFITGVRSGFGLSCAGRLACIRVTPVPQTTLNFFVAPGSH